MHTTVLLILLQCASGIVLTTRSRVPSVRASELQSFLATSENWPRIVASSVAVESPNDGGGGGGGGGGDVGSPLQPGETVDEIFGLPPVLPLRVSWTCVANDAALGLLDVISKAGLEGVAKECRMRFLVADAPGSEGGDEAGADVELTMSYEPTSPIAVAAAPILALDNAFALKVLLPLALQQQRRQQQPSEGIGIEKGSSSSSSSSGGGGGRSSSGGSGGRGGGGEDEEEEEEKEEAEGAKEEYEAEDAPARRFLSPRVDDVGLILADAQIAGVILPGLVAIGNVAAGTRPSWLGYGNGLVLPTVSHGSGLAICWILGALAARAYEKVAFSEYPTAVGRTLKGGAFAAGLLILATQLRLASDGLAGPVDPDVVDENLVEQLRAAGELAVDIAAEAAGLLAWRVYRTYLTGQFGE